MQYSHLTKDESNNCSEWKLLSFVFLLNGQNIEIVSKKSWASEFIVEREIIL
jgi:hypothetical protein